jgi:hypothetical protein
MPLKPDDHLNNLVRHLDLVRDACLLLGKRLMAHGEIEFGRILVSRGYQHDASKFSGIEWDYLHAGPDVDKEKLAMAIDQHVRTNSHHPEYWGGINQMPRIAVAEMVCDWYARSQEFGTSLREWIKEDATPRFKITQDHEQSQWISRFLDLLLQDSFAH